MLYLFLLQAMTFSGPHADLSIQALKLSPQSIQVTVYLAPDSGWHTYWKNPGDSGMPPSLNLTHPDMAVASDLIFPVPEIIRTENETTFGYHQPVVFIATVTLPDLKMPDSLSGMFRYLICKEECIPGRIRFTIPVEMKSSEILWKSTYPLPKFNHPFLVQAISEAGNLSITIEDEQLPESFQLIPEDGKLFRGAGPFTANKKGNTAVWNLPLLQSVEKGQTVSFLILSGPNAWQISKQIH